MHGLNRGRAANLLEGEPLNLQAAERLGYLSQKPLALIERIIKLTTDPGDVVLDPFCGCGTANVRCYQFTGWDRQHRVSGRRGRW